MKTSRAIIEAFPGKHNAGLRGKIRDLLRQEYVLTASDMADHLGSSIAFTPKGEANLAWLVKQIDDVGTVWDL